MLNQVSVEAVYSATYVENYLDCVENLPDDLQRLISRMRELDVYYIGERVAVSEAREAVECVRGKEVGFALLSSLERLTSVRVL